MIQFNLLPDVKLEYIKSRRTKHTVYFVSFIVGAVSLAVLISLFSFVFIAQKKTINDLTKDIKESSDKLKAVPELDKVLTIQNQLSSLTCDAKEVTTPSNACLHDRKPVTSRMFGNLTQPGYLTQITPLEVTISDVNVNYSENTIEINGNADAISSVNKYVDSFKFAEYKVEGIEGQSRAFSNVELVSYAVNPKPEPGKENKKVSYEIKLSFDPIIFQSFKKVTLIPVPKNIAGGITTRSQTEKPTALFESDPNTQQQGGQ